MGGRVYMRRVGNGWSYRVVTDVIVAVVAIALVYRWTDSEMVDVEMEVHLDSGTQHSHVSCT